MSRFPTDCLTAASITPNSTIFARIEACQAAANTTYCYPPNGTKICVPALDIPVFWPKGPYHSDDKVALSWDPTSSLILLRNNTGNDTQDYTPYMYDYRAAYLPDQPYHRAMPMSILERRFNNVDDPMNLETHDGPIVILVQTAEWPGQMSAYAAPTATGVDYSHDFDSGSDDRKLKGIIAVIVLGVVAVIVLAFFCCYRKCCCVGVRERGRLRMGRKERAGVVAQGEDVMAMWDRVGKSLHLHRVEDGLVAGADQDESTWADGSIREVDETGREDADVGVGVVTMARVDVPHGSRDGDDMRAHGDPPPKYTPKDT